MKTQKESWIVGGVRTPIGAMGGALAGVPAPHLGAVCIKALLARTGAPPSGIDEVIMGNVVAAGLGQNPVRQAALRRPHLAAQREGVQQDDRPAVAGGLVGQGHAVVRGVPGVHRRLRGCRGPCCYR